MGCNCSRPRGLESTVQQTKARSEWGEVIAFNVDRAYRIFETQFENYVQRSPDAVQASALTEARRKAKQEVEDFRDTNRALYARIWMKYDTTGSGELSRKQCARMTLDLLMEQRKYLPDLLEAFTRDLVRLTESAMGKVKEDTGVDDEFITELLEKMRAAIEDSVEALVARLDMMIREYESIADRAWMEMMGAEAGESATVRRDVFLDRYQRIQQGLFHPELLVQQLAGLVAETGRPIAAPLPPSVFVPTRRELERKAEREEASPWTALIAMSLQRVYEIFQQRFLELDQLTFETTGIAPNHHDADAELPEREEEHDPGAAGGSADNPLLNEAAYESNVSSVQRRLTRNLEQFRVRSEQVFAAVFAKYDRDQDGKLTRSECRELTLDMLMEEKQHTPKLCDALIQDLIEMARIDARKPPPGFPLAIPEEFANQFYVETLADATLEALTQLTRSLDEMLKDHVHIADSIWQRLEDPETHLIEREVFIKRLHEVALPLKMIEPERLADHLQGF